MATTYEEILELFRETDRKFQDTDRKFQDTDRKFQDTDRKFQELTEAQKDTDRKFQETDRKFQDTDRKFQELTEAQKETDRKFQETDRKFQETDRKFQELAEVQKETKQFLKEQSLAADQRMKRLDQQLGKLGNRLGEFVEGLVKPALVRLFQAQGIAVHEVHADIEVNRHDEGLQIDLLVVNDCEAVVVEVKSKLAQADVNEHLERLEKFKRLLPRYADARILGAMAAMVVPDDVAHYAYRQGLFVLAQSGESVVILNKAPFQPRAW